MLDEYLKYDRKIITGHDINEVNIMFDLSGKLAFVTGSSRGIGKAFAIKLATVKTTQAIFCKSFRLRAGGRRKPPLKNLNSTVKIKKSECIVHSDFSFI